MEMLYTNKDGNVPGKRVIDVLLLFVGQIYIIPHVA
jgi:hypothetical protein